MLFLNISLGFVIIDNPLLKGNISSVISLFVESCGLVISVSYCRTAFIDILFYHCIWLQIEIPWFPVTESKISRSENSYKPDCSMHIQWKKQDRPT